MTIEHRPSDSVYFDLVPIAASVEDRRGRLVSVNQSFCALFGVQRDSILGKEVTDIYPSGDFVWVREIHRRLLAGEIDIFRSSGLFVTAGGMTERLHVVAVAAYEDQLWDFSPVGSRGGERDHDDGQAPLHIISTYDYAPPVPFAKDDSYLKRVLSSSRSLLLTLDTDNQVTFVAGWRGASLAYPNDFWIGRELAEIVVADDQPRLRAFLATLYEQPDTPEDIELRVYTADGSERVVLVSGTNLLDDPVVGAIVLSVQDVSELHDQITELVEDTRTAEMLAAQRSDLIATVSHELRNPLHALQGLSELLATAELPADLTGVATELHTQLVGLARVTSDLLDAARADRGEIELVRESVSLRTLLDRALRYGEVSIGTKPIDIRGVLEPHSPEAVMLDAARVDQIVRNLVGNAAKFTESGSIIIIIGPIPQGIHFTVTDTGPGIPAADLDKVLEPFARGSNTVESTGAGLGLAIVNDLVASMGGRVTVESTVGAGARFRAEIKAPRSVGVPAAVPEIDHNKRFDTDVLVVDDDRTNRLIATRLLERIGCRVHEAHSGEHALRLLEQPASELPVDVVLMDRRMPGMDGLETTQAIRQIPHRADVFVVALTASTSPAERAACVEATMDDFVSKPATLVDLRRAIAASVRGHTSRAATPAASSVTTPPTDLIDEERIASLVEEFDDADLVRNLIDMFLTDLPAQLDEIAGAQASGDLDVASRVAHTIKGSAAMLGAPALMQLSKAAELEPTNPLDDLNLVARQTMDQFRRILDDGLPGVAR